jgi:GH25 family lysozyme M1 (1,4-beta-N-acetylmuramidase)
MSAYVRGIDVSGWQPASVPWAQLRDEHQIAFTCLKASEGTSFTDPQFDAHLAGARAAGIRVGAYHFARPVHSATFAEQEAHRFFLASGALGSSPGELPPLLDLEAPTPGQWAKYGLTASKLRDWAIKFLDTCESLFGCKPMVYSYPYFLNAMADVGDVASYPLWLASYTSQDWPSDGTPAPIHTPWTRATFWQWYDAYEVPGIGRVDADVWCGSAADLEAFCASSRI